MSEILVVGSVGYDSISTPSGHKDGIIGGSANYFSLGASKYSKVNVVGVVGDDYKDADKELLTSRGIDLKGLQQMPGETFKWSGKYENDMNEAITLETHLNVFEKFNPIIPESYRDSKYVFLANIDPVLQKEVLTQVNNPKLTSLDTMNFWIQSKKEDLVSMIKSVDVLLINEGEARELTGKYNGIAAIKDLLALGPKAVVMKRGEYGFVLYCENKYFILPAFPIDNVVDPTGAGDTFAGGFFGYLSKIDDELGFEHYKQACVHGCLLASFTVQDFGIQPLLDLSWTDLEKRQSEYRSVIQ